MNLILELYTGLGLILLALLFAVFALIIIYFRLLKKYLQLKQQKLTTEAAVKQEVMARLARANAESAIKLQEAAKRSKEIIESAMLQKMRTESSLSKALKELEKEQQTIILTTKNAQELNQAPPIIMQNNISKDIERYSETRINDYKKAMEQETKKSQRKIELNFELEKKHLEEDLKIYQQNKIKEIDEKILRIVQAVSKETLGKTLNIKEHETLVLQALENAKQEGKL